MYLLHCSVIEDYLAPRSQPVYFHTHKMFHYIVCHRISALTHADYLHVLPALRHAFAGAWLQPYATDCLQL